VFGATRVTTIGAMENILTDLSFEDKFSDIVGFTEKEIRTSYKERLEEIAEQKTNSNVDDLLGILKGTYDHHKFTPTSKLIYNPHSILSYLRDNPVEPEHYWAKSTEQRPLFKTLIEEFPRQAIDLVIEKKTSRLLTTKYLTQRLDRNEINEGNTDEFYRILLQTGLMTLGECRSYGKVTKSTLRITNKETETMMTEVLQANMETTQNKLIGFLEERQFEPFMCLLDENIALWLKNVPGKYYSSETNYEIIVGYILHSGSSKSLDVMKEDLSRSLTQRQVDMKIKEIDLPVDIKTKKN